MGYEIIRQRGSHIRMRKTSEMGEHNITVPAHSTIARGTLNDILNRVSLWNNVPKETLIRTLSEL
jgi:predicted RNA binding protein YcfA (HicA-like mRNA interferase family)